jgi:hypothetical protein
VKVALGEEEPEGVREAEKEPLGVLLGEAVEEGVVEGLREVAALRVGDLEVSGEGEVLPLPLPLRVGALGVEDREEAMVTEIKGATVPRGVTVGVGGGVGREEVVGAKDVMASPTAAWVNPPPLLSPTRRMSPLPLLPTSTSAECPFSPMNRAVGGEERVAGSKAREDHKGPAPVAVA